MSHLTVCHELMISNSKYVYGMLYFSKGLNAHWNKFLHLGSFETKETCHVPTGNGCYLHLCSIATVGLCPDHSSVNQPPASLDLLLQPLGTFSCSVGCLVLAQDLLHAHLHYFLPRNMSHQHSWTFSHHLCLSDFHLHAPHDTPLAF